MGITGGYVKMTQMQRLREGNLTLQEDNVYNCQQSLAWFPVGISIGIYLVFSSNLTHGFIRKYQMGILEYLIARIYGGFIIVITLFDILRCKCLFDLLILNNSVCFIPDWFY